MKRSRIFLGLTTACLAIAGVVAAKAHFGLAGKAFYYTLTPGLAHNFCTQGATTGVYFTATSNNQYSYVTSGGVNIIPAYLSATCKKPLDYKIKS